MTCLKITKSQNGQIYPEDTFSHGAAHMQTSKSVLGFQAQFYTKTQTNI